MWRGSRDQALSCRSSSGPSHEPHCDPEREAGRRSLTAADPQGGSLAWHSIRPSAPQEPRSISRRKVRIMAARRNRTRVSTPVDRLGVSATSRYGGRLGGCPPRCDAPFPEARIGRRIDVGEPRPVDDERVGLRSTVGVCTSSSPADPGMRRIDGRRVYCARTAPADTTIGERLLSFRRSPLTCFRSPRVFVGKRGGSV